MDPGLPIRLRQLEQQQCDMRVDEHLRTACMDACRGATDSKKKRIEDLWDQYEGACRLSRGGNKERSSYWEFKARTIERDLRQIVGTRAW